jgi:hypothetical protein
MLNINPRVKHPSLTHHQTSFLELTLGVASESAGHGAPGGQPTTEQMFEKQRVE